MMGQNITVKELKAFNFKQSFASYAGPEGRKELVVVTVLRDDVRGIWFDVYKDGKLIEQTQNMDEAVKTFNEL